MTNENKYQGLFCNCITDWKHNVHPPHQSLTSCSAVGSGVGMPWTGRGKRANIWGRISITCLLSVAAVTAAWKDSDVFPLGKERIK